MVDENKENHCQPKPVMPLENMSLEVTHGTVNGAEFYLAIMKAEGKEGVLLGSLLAASADESPDDPLFMAWVNSLAAVFTRGVEGATGRKCVSVAMFNPPNGEDDA